MYVCLFVSPGAFLLVSGAGTFFTGLAYSMAGGLRGGTQRLPHSVGCAKAKKLIFIGR